MYGMDLILLGLSWGGFFRCRLADSDTLWGNIDPGATLISRRSNFRWLGYIGDSFSYQILNYYPYEHRVLSFALFLIVLAAALLFLQLTFRDTLSISHWDRKWKIVYLAITSLCFINVLSSELFYFTESYLIFKASLLAAMAGCFLFGRKHYVTGTVLFFVAPMFYQMSSIYAALVLCTLAYLEEEGKGFLRICQKEFAYLLAALAGGVLNYVTGPWICQKISRRVGFDISPSKQIRQESMLETLKKVMPQLRELYESSLGLMMPVWLPAIFSLLITGLVLYILVRMGDKQQIGIYLIYKVVSFALMCGMSVVSFQNEFVCRVTAPFYTMQAMNALIALFYLKRAGKQAAEWIAEAAVIGYLAMQCFFIQIIISNRILSENLDILYANQVLDYVKKYEEQTGKKVFDAAFCADSSCSEYYEQVNYCHSAINSRIAGKATYSLVETVALWRGMDLGRGEMDSRVYEEYFAGKNWDSFDPEEQIVIMNGTLYWCVF